MLDGTEERRGPEAGEGAAGREEGREDELQGPDDGQEENDDDEEEDGAADMPFLSCCC